jgi:WD40 repeat protein
MRIAGDQTIGITDEAEGVEIRRFKGFRGRLTAAGLTPDGTRAAVVSDDGTVTVWDRDNESDMPGYQAQPGVKCLLSPDARWVIALNRSVISRLIDLNTGQVVRTMMGVGTNDFFTRSPEGHCVLCSWTNETLDMFDLERNTRLYSLKTDSARSVTAIGLTAEGGRAVIASHQLLSCSDLASGECLATFIPERPIRACSLSSDARIVIAVDEGGTIHFLSVETGDLLLNLASLK